MRYEDASGAFQASGPVANDDSDTLAAGSRGPATGNLISGEGTQYGSAGADSAAGAHVTAIAGKGGEDSSFAAGKLSVAGEFGQLSVDAEGNYSYLANKGAPENVRDRFTYTLADNQGNSDTAALIVEIGKTPVVIKADAQQIVPGPDGVVTLPPGVELSDIMVVGRNLVINMPDGTQLIIIDGAVFVPQLVLGGVEVPASNVAALLIGQEPQPAAGETPPSSGGNFALPPPPLDPAAPLGDLIPPTEYTYTPPEPQETFLPEDSEPEVGPNPDVLLDDDALQGGNAGGVGDDPDAVNVTGQLSGSGGDGVLTFNVLLTGAPAGFTYVSGGAGIVLIQQGGVTVLTVTVDSDGSYSVVQNAPIDHSAGSDENNVLFTIDYTVTDEDGDSAAGTFSINVDDDTPLLTELVAQGGVTLDETTAGSPAGFPISSNSVLPIIDFTALFGADGAAAVDSTEIGLVINGGGNSGLQTAVGDFPITLVQIDGDTIEGHYNGSNVAFIIQLEADGTITLTQNVPLEHLVDGPPGPAHDDAIDLGGLIGVSVTITDGDGDQATGQVGIGDLLVFKDDGPDAQVDPEARLDRAVLDETRPEGTDTDDGSPVATPPSGLASATLDFADNFGTSDFGADGAGTITYQLLLSANGIGSGLYALQPSDTSGADGDGYGQGAEITLSQSGNTITGSAGGVNYFTITINPATGEVTFTQLNPIWHPTPGDWDEIATLTTELASDIQVQQTVTDSDGDFDTATVDIGHDVFAIQDDGPDQFEECPEDVITVNQVGSEFTGDLNLPDVGEDEPGTITFNVSDGDPVLDNSANPVTSNGVALFYFINDQGVLEARAGGETGDVIFTVTINGDGTFTYNQLGPIGDSGVISFTDLTSTNAGNVEFRGVGADDPTTTVDLLLSAEDGGADATVNTDSDSIGAANQSMDDGETVRIDFVSDLTSGAGTPSGFGYTGHVSTSSFIGLIPQVQGDQSQTVAFTVWALDSNVAQGTEPDRNPAGGFSDSTITAITEVTVKDYLTGDSTTVDVTGYVVGVFTPVAYGISVRVNADGSVTFSGIQQGDSYGFSTGAGDFNAVAVQSDPAGTGGSTQDSFDLGVFSIGTAADIEPVDLTVPITFTDADGDPVVCDIDIHLGPPVVAPDITITVNEAGLDLIGSDGGSDSEIETGDLQGQVTGGTGPYTFTLVSSGDGTYGTLVLNPDGTYTYTLDTPFDTQPDADDGTNPELGAETFTFEATDSLGAKQTGTITVNIIDDVPTAVDDTDSIAAGQYGPVDGNVITDASAGDAGDGDNGADTKGADGATVVGVIAGDTNADLDNPATVGVVIQGAYGKLTLYSDGSYTYTRDPGTDGGVEDVFTYTIEDGDGDRSNATLTITIDDSPPTIDAPDEGEAGTIVDEKGLPTRGESPGTGEFADGNGNDNDDTSETTSGVITFTAPDGPAIIRIDGVVVTGVVGQTFNGSHGVLTITSYNAGTGQIGYSYTLSDNTSGDATFDDFALEVEDQDGDIANDTLTIDIIDDEPLASNDVDSVTGGFDPATGNVLTGVEVAVADDGNGTDGVADNPGADGGTVTNIDHDASPAEAVPNGGSTDIQGDYGVLTIYSNGDYSYQRDPGTPGGVEDVFTYTLTDGDGDTTTATLTIGIDDNFPTLPNPATVLLDDDVIPGANGNLNGPGDDDPDAVPGNVVNGNLVGSGGDGDLDYYFTGTNTLPTGFSIGAGSDVNTLIIVQDQNGSDVTVMTIELNNETGAFTVTQNNPIWHPADNSGPDDNIENNLNFSIGVEVQDADGDDEPATITINVDDDTPTINVTKGDDSAVTLTTDDAQTEGGASDTAVSTANFSGVFGLVQSAGADGTNAAATLLYTLDVTGYAGGPAGVNSGLESHNADIFLYEIGGKVVGSTSATLAGVDGTNTVFDVQVATDGVVTLTQYQQIDHDTVDPTPTGSPFADHIVSLTDGLVTLTASASLTDKDGDTVTDSETVNIGANLRFTDDGPDAQPSGTGVGTVTLDETRAEGTDTTGGTPPSGDQSATIDFSINFVTGGSVDYGADGPGSVTYALQLTGTNVNSGLYALDNTDTETAIDGYGQGGQIVLNQVGNTITGSYNGTNYFTITIDPNTGIVTFTQLNNIWHPNAGSSAAALDETATLNTIAANLIQVVQTVTDFDGDTDTASINIGQGVFQIQDDGPRFGPDIDATLSILNDANPSNTGDLDIVIGTDSPNGPLVGADPAQTQDDISVTNFTVQVNGVDATNVVLTPGAENATTASYSFTFDYDTGDGGTATATGTLVFNKAAGTYTVELTNGPIEGFSVASVQNGLPPVFYDVDQNNDGDTTDAADNNIVAVVEIADSFFIQFTGQSDVTTPASQFGLNDLWGGGVQSEVKISSSAIGVFGNSVQDSDVLDYNFYATDPGADFDNPPTTSAGTAFIQVTQFNGAEDFVVTLKLADPNSPGTFITRTIVVNPDDVITTDVPGYPTLENGEGLIIIEPSDYIGLPGVPDNYEIVGMQLRSSTEGVSSTAGEVFNFDGGLGEVDNSTAVFGPSGGGDQGTNDNDVFKIIDIGVVITSTEDQSATIDFDVNIHDADGDTATQHISVDIGDTQSVAALPPEPVSLAAESTGDSSVSNLSFSNDNQKLNGHGNDKNFSSINNTGIMAGIVAAAGLQSTAVAAQSFEPSVDFGLQDMMQTAGLPAYQLQSIDDGSFNVQSFGLESGAPAFDFSALQGSGHNFNDFVDGGGLDVQSYGDAMPAYEPSFAVDQTPAIDASMLVASVAPAVGMPSAEALIAAGLVGGVQQGGTVEQILADALSGAAPTVDSLLDAVNGGPDIAPAVEAALNALQGGGGAGDLSAVLNGTSPDFGAVSSWDMSMPGSIGAGFDVMFKMDVATLHQDAVQPTVNG